MILFNIEGGYPMSEFEKYNQNPYNKGEENTSQNQTPNYKVPQYSFWAEQMPNTNVSHQQPSTNINNQNQGWNYSGQTGYSQGGYNQTGYNQAGYNQTGYGQTGYNRYGYNPSAYNQPGYGQPTMQTAPKPKKEHKALKLIGKGISFGLIAALTFIGVQHLYYEINPNAKPQQFVSNQVEDTKYEISYTDPGEVKYQDRSAISALVDETMPAIVSIHSISTQTTQWFGQRFDEEVEGSGSGFIVGKDEKELLIATNNHVVSGTNKITVTFNDGSTADAVIKGTDATADLAVISVDISTVKKETLDAIEIAKLGNSDDVKVGEMSIAIGNALGYGQSVTVGFISAKDREVEVSDGYKSKKMVLLQTDAAINPGNSGGALLNVKGEVIGINTVKYASNEVEGMGYAIPISRAIPIINELMSREILEEEEQGYLGITGNDVTEEVAEFYNMPIGVFINEVVKNGAADKAGLKAGDIIIKVNDIEITAITQLREYVTSLRVGTKVEVTYMRNTNGKYKEEKVTVTLGKNPNLNTDPQ